MLFILRWLKRLWRRPARRAVMESVATTDPHGTVQEPSVATTDPHAPSVPIPVVITKDTGNRHDRRALEKKRRKYDKFVTPQGAPPEKEKPPRQPRTKKVEVPAPEIVYVDDAEYLIADSHHENRSDIVAYKEAELQGEFNFRDTILQQLERYFVYLERMKKHDPDSYGFYREVGASVLPYIATGAWNREGTAGKERQRHYTPLADWFHQTRPTFGCFAYGADPETERYEQTAKRDKHALWVPKFMYFRKYKQPPPEIQFITGGDIYVMTIWWDRPFDKKVKYGHPQEFSIFVSADGKEVVALRCCETKYIEIPSKKETGRALLHRRGFGHFHIPKRAWHIPHEFERWAKDNGEDVQHFLTELFREAVARNEMAQYSMTRITATKGDVTAAFAVNIHRTAYFFQDRDVHLNEEGSRKRIFHFVRPHVRNDGTVVKAHFRGEHEFDWAGYHINITIPGRDHLHIADFSPGAVDDYWSEPGVKYLHKPELGKMMKDWTLQGVGRTG